MKNNQNWEQEIPEDAEAYYDWSNDRNDLVAFIKKVLLSQEERIVEIIKEFETYAYIPELLEQIKQK